MMAPRCLARDRSTPRSCRCLSSARARRAWPARLAWQAGADYDAVILATGFRPGLAELVAIPGLLDEAGYPRAARGTGSASQVFFVGYRIVSTGHLREIALEARSVAAAISAA